MNACTIIIGAIHGKKTVFMVYMKIKLNVKYTSLYMKEVELNWNIILQILLGILLKKI